MYERIARTDIGELRRLAAPLEPTGNYGVYERVGHTNVAMIRNRTSGLKQAEYPHGPEWVGPSDLATVWRILMHIAGEEPPLINEGFEGAGIPSGWTQDCDVNNLAADFDYSAAPLAGTKSLRLDARGSGNGSEYQVVMAPPIDAIEAAVTFRMKVEALPGVGLSTGLVYAYGVNTYSSFTYLYPDGGVSLDPEPETFAVGKMVAGHTYDCLYYAKKGTGNDSVCKFAWVEAGGEIPTSGDQFISISNGTLAENITTVAFYNYWQAVLVFDNVQVSAPTLR